MQEILIHKQEEQSEQIAKFEESFTQSMNPNYMPQAPTQQKRIFIRQPQLTTAPMSPMSIYLYIYIYFFIFLYFIKY